MNNSLIVGYIDRLRIEDIDNFSRKMGVILEEEELELITKLRITKKLVPYLDYIQI